MAGEFCAKIVRFIQIIVEGIVDIGHKRHIEIFGHCVHLQQKSTNQNQICILASEKATVSCPYEYKFLIHSQSDKF